MKRYVRTSEEKQGVFWDIDGELLSFPYTEDEHTSGIAKSGNTYNHKALWPDIKQHKCNKPFNYYPRGRVVIDNQGRVIIYMNTNVSAELIPQIRTEFGIKFDPR